MADRYWVGGSGTWDTTTTTNWSTASGGAGGASAPGAADQVFIDANSGAGTITTAAGATCRNLDCTGFTGILAGTSGLTLTGNMTLGSGMTWTNTGTLVFSPSSASTYTVTTNGITLTCSIQLNGTGSTWVLGSNLATQSNRTLTLARGAINIDGKALTVGAVSTSNSNVREINFGAGGIINCASDVLASTATNLTVSGTGTINMTGAIAKTFAGGGATWPTLNQGGAGTLTITGANAFADITNTVQPATIRFPASTTTTVGIFKVSGTPAGQITLNSSTAATQATISTLDSRPVTASYVSIQDIAATGKSDWYADTGRGAVDLGNNTGWQFVPLAVRQVIRGVMRSIIRPIMYPDRV